MVLCVAACGKTENSEPRSAGPDDPTESSGTGGDAADSGGSTSGTGSTGPMNDSGGSAPEPGADGGAPPTPSGGSPSSGDGCPDYVPDAEDDCEPGRECSYPSSLEGCAQPPSLRASCEAGTWVIERPVACTAPSDCRLVVGSYEFTSSPGQGLGGGDAQGCLDAGADITRSFEIVEGRDSTVHVRGVWDFVQLDGCELTLTYYFTYETEFELEVDTETLIVQFEQDGVAGAHLIQEDSCGGYLDRPLTVSGP